jgi:integrase
MSWDDKQKRWVKMYKGQRYTVACSVLGAPDTKDGSRVAANNWWKAKRAEIDSKNTPRPPLPLEDLYRAWVDGFCPEEWQKTLYEQQFAASPERVIRRVVEGMVGALMSGQPMPTEIAERMPPARLLQVETAVAGLRGQPTAEPEKTVAAYCERWHEGQRTLVHAGQRSAAHTDNQRICIGYFRDWIGGQSDVSGIDGERLRGFFGWCVQKIVERNADAKGKAGWSVVYAKKTFGVARTFVKWLAELDVIPLPKNIASPSFNFKDGPKDVPTWTVEEFKTALAAATGQLRLHLLLMANCGFTQVDIADLKDSEVDWKAGRITRKRSKTRDHEDVPTVNYPLWPTTFAFLQQYRSGGPLALLTEKGGAWVWGRLENGVLKTSDNIASNYTHLKEKLKPFKKPLKELRKTAATLIESKLEYRGFSTLFLGHSPRTVADRHYVRPPQELFDQAVRWLGQQLGQVEVEKPAKAKAATSAKGSKKP